MIWLVSLCTLSVFSGAFETSFSCCCSPLQVRELLLHCWDIQLWVRLSWALSPSSHTSPCTIWNFPSRTPACDINTIIPTFWSMLHFSFWSLLCPVFLLYFASHSFLQGTLSWCLILNLILGLFLWFLGISNHIITGILDSGPSVLVFILNLIYFCCVVCVPACLYVHLWRPEEGTGPIGDCGVWVLLQEHQIFFLTS